MVYYDIYVKIVYIIHNYLFSISFIILPLLLQSHPACGNESAQSSPQTCNDRQALESFLGVIDQAIDIMILQNVRRSVKYADLILVPQLEEFHTLDFASFESIMERGYRAAETKSVLLQPLSLEPSQWESHLRQRAIQWEPGHLHHIIPGKYIPPNHLGDHINH